MSLALSALANVGHAIGDILIHVQRSMYPTQQGVGGGLIIPDCVIEETSRDDLQITEHPVEIGSVIADHAFKKPRELTLRWSWSNSGRYEMYMQDVFNSLVTMQNRREPLTIVAGKGMFVNMLIASLGSTTNSSAEYALNAIMVCREVIIVQTQSVSVAPQDAMKEPPSTGGVVSRGQVQLSGNDVGDRTLSNWQTNTATV